MNSKEIIELLEQFGFSSGVKDRKIKFIDSNTWEPAYIEGSKDGSISSNAFSVGSYFAMHSAITGNKIIRMTFAHPLIKGVRDQSQVIIKSAYVGCGNTDCDVEYSNFNGDLKFHACCDKNKEIETRIDIQFRPRHSIYINIQNDMSHYRYITGEYDFVNREVTNESDLSSTGILNVLNNNKQIATFIEYYGKIFPEFLESMEALRDSSKKRMR